MKKEVGMGGSDENDCGLVKQSNHQGGSRGGGGKSMPSNDAQRRALSDIDENILGPQPANHPAEEKHLAEKQGTSSKRPRIPVHRPITRKLAAEIANKQQLPLTKASTCCDSDDDDYPVPASVHHTEAMMDEIDNEMVEVEMEDMAVEMIANIDNDDKGNPLAVIEYINEMYAFFKELEGCVAVPPNYMVNQFDINQKMRAILVDWLIEVHYKFELMDETLFLTVNIIDRFLAGQQVVRKKLQLVGITAMLIACKYEEVSVPVVEDLILISDKAYSRDEVLEMERLIVNTLEFNLSVPTPYVFMRRFLKAAQSDEKLELLSFFMVELCLVEYEMVRFKPSLLAAAAIFTAQCAMNGHSRWNRTIEWHSSYSEQQLVECSRLMAGFHQNAGSGKLTGVYRKYSTSRFGHAAKFEPAHFLLE